MEDIFDEPSFALARLGSNTFLLEYCEDFEKGLSGREHLHDNEGMLFPLNQKNKVSFHMKDCLIPLDIIFIEDGMFEASILNGGILGGTILIIEGIPKLSTSIVAFIEGSPE